MDGKSKTSPRWLRIIIPLVLILAWLAVAGVGGPTFGKISSVSTNDQAAFLPANAESTVVRDWQSKFVDSKTIPAVVLLTTEQPLTPEQLKELAALAARLGAVDGVEQPQAPAPTSIAGPIPSEDKLAVEFIVPIADTANVKTIVADLREVLANTAPDGLTPYVTGPAGLTADLVKAFSGIDGILLLVALLAVFVILLVVYRSVVLPILVLLTSVVALCGAILVVYLLAKSDLITLSGQSQGILSILVIGAATDYSLLLVARFREALHHVDSKFEAIRMSMKGAWEPIVASGATVILALLCLLFSDLNSNRSLGPVAAVGIVFALLSALTFLPAVLVACGRAAFWPFLPKVEGAHHRHAAGKATSIKASSTMATSVEATGGSDEVELGVSGVSGVWRRVALLVAHKPRITWVVTLVLLLAASSGVLQLQANGVSQTQVILAKSDAVDGQAELAKHFDGGSGSPVVIVASASKQAQVITAVEQEAGVAAVSVYDGGSRPTAGAPGLEKDGRVLINATLEDQADSQAAEGVVKNLRADLPAVDAGVLVGGVTAIALDTNLTAQSDLIKIVPLVLLVILVVIMVLLRSIVAPLVLVGTVVLSYAAAMGVSALVFNHVFKFPGADATVPLFGFVFLVALGVDYNIFLMTRVREEAIHLGPRAGVLRGLGMTGGVITSAGVVLAATFAALGVIPLLFLVQLAFIVAFGVLLDTVIVRSLLVPAISYDLGRHMWWPSKLGRRNGLASAHKREF